MFRFTPWAVRCTGLLVACLSASPLPAQTVAPRLFRAGAATSNITPPLGSPIVGGFVAFPATHVHDELHARCLVLDDGTTRLVLVVCDLLGIDRLVSDDARAALQRELGMPPDNVLVAATHTHSAASALGQDARIVSHTMDEYQRFVSRRIVDGVKRAVNLLRPAQVACGTAEAPEHVFNRRWFMKPGAIPPNPFGNTDRVRMNPPAGSPDLLEPAGPTDPVIPFLALREPGGKPIAVFSSYSLHYVGGVGAGHISADYYGMYADALARLLDADRQTPPFVALMSNGTSGDVNNINFRRPRSKQQPYEQMRHVAEDVARKVHAALGKAVYRDHVTLAARYREPIIGVRRPGPELVAWAKKTLAEQPRTAGKANLPAIYAERTLRMAEHPAALKMPLQAFSIGDVALATMPCEVFCEIGLEFKKRSPIQPAWLVSLGHGYYGYLPTPRQHELGGYETCLGTNRLEVRASEKMLSALLEMVAELRPSPTSSAAPQGDFSKVPGGVVTHRPAAGGQYIGSASIAVLGDGSFLATHDLFGPRSTEHTSAVTRVFRSTDRGQTWTHLTDIDGAFWSTVFEHRGAVYLLGTTKHHGNVVIRRSSDGGRTWTTPRDKDTGLLREGPYHCAPVPVVEHRGRLWRGFEDAGGGTAWGKRYRAMMLSAPADADLLRADSWTSSNFLTRDPQWLGGTFNAWLEGNAVVTPDGHVVDILRVDARPKGATAAMVRISDDGKSATFDPQTGFLRFPGGATKFTIRRDPASKRYWALTNYVPPQHAGPNPAGTRNTLALVCSSDLKDWEVRCVVLYHPDRTRHAFQYVDWHFDGDDLVAVSRTAYDDGLGGARSAHDANFLTFHRIRNFRDLAMKDSTPSFTAAPAKPGR